MRRQARVDANHREVVSALRAAGCLVVDLAPVGGGIPDLLVGRAGRWVLIEVKDGSKRPSKRRLTDAQRRFHAEADARNAGPVRVATNVPEALDALGFRAADAHAACPRCGGRIRARDGGLNG